MSFSGNVVAHCGDAEAHAASSQEHIEKDNTNEGNEKKEKKSNFEPEKLKKNYPISEASSRVTKLYKEDVKNNDDKMMII